MLTLTPMATGDATISVTATDTGGDAADTATVSAMVTVGVLPLEIMVSPTTAEVEEGGTVEITATANKMVDRNVEVMLLPDVTGSTAGEDDYSLAPSAMITIMAGEVSGMATLTATDDYEVEGNESVTLVAREKDMGDIGTVMVSIMDNDMETTYTLSGPMDMNIVEGQSYELTATANQAVHMDTEVMLVRDRAASDAGDDDYTVGSITIAAGATSGTTMLMVTADDMPDGGDRYEHGREAGARRGRWTAWRSAPWSSSSGMPRCPPCRSSPSSCWRPCWASADTAGTCGGGSRSADVRSLPCPLSPERPRGEGGFSLGREPGHGGSGCDHAPREPRVLSGGLVPLDSRVYRRVGWSVIHVEDAGRQRVHARPRPSNGSSTSTPAFSKSARFRVATTNPCASAVAAIRLSLTGMAVPDVRRSARSLAQRRPVAASHGRHCSRPTPPSNQRSRPRPSPAPGQQQDAEPDSPRGPPRPRRVPVRFAGASPRPPGREPAWWPRSARSHRPGRSQRVGALGLDRNEEALLRTVQQPIDDACVRRRRPADESVLPRLDAFDVELLARLDAVLAPNLGRQHDLPLRGDGGLHRGKILSYPEAVNRVGFPWEARHPQDRNEAEYLAESSAEDNDNDCAATANVWPTAIRARPTPIPRSSPGVNALRSVIPCPNRLHAFGRLGTTSDARGGETGVDTDGPSREHPKPRRGNGHSLPGSRGRKQAPSKSQLTVEPADGLRGRVVIDPRSARQSH